MPIVKTAFSSYRSMAAIQYCIASIMSLIFRSGRCILVHDLIAWICLCFLFNLVKRPKGNFWRFEVKGASRPLVIWGITSFMKRFNPRIHHRKSIRLKGYDYAQAGLYFITICCQDRICRFGHIENRQMVLNESGRIANDEWMKTPEIRPNVKLHEFVVMPNHMHGIIQILYPGTGTGVSHLRDDGRGEPHTHDDDSPDDGRGEFNSPHNVSPVPPRGTSQTVGAIVRGYKSAVTKQINMLGMIDGPKKLWQRNYYERIIWNEKSYQRISKYIIDNPAKWADDKFYK